MEVVGGPGFFGAGFYWLWVVIGAMDFSFVVVWVFVGYLRCFRDVAECLDFGDGKENPPMGVSVMRYVSDFKDVAA